MTAKRMTEERFREIVADNGLCPIERDQDFADCDHKSCESDVHALMDELARARESEKRLVEALKMAANAIGLAYHSCAELNCPGGECLHCEAAREIDAALQAAGGEET